MGWKVFQKNLPPPFFLFAYKIKKGLKKAERFWFIFSLPAYMKKKKPGFYLDAFKIFIIYSF